jgi:hypothetical protein
MPASAAKQNTSEGSPQTDETCLSKSVSLSKSKSKSDQSARPSTTIPIPIPIPIPISISTGLARAGLQLTQLHRFWLLKEF